jgi:hypothetical protein
MTSAPVSQNRGAANGRGIIRIHLQQKSGQRIQLQSLS